MTTPATTEAIRVVNICNACRYCEGHCAVFPAITRQLTFTPADMEQLAHLCHSCGACFQHCQYSPPHEFGVNFPKVMADVRTESYPVVAGRRFTTVTAFASVAIFILLIVNRAGFDALFADTHNFYHLLPHNVMASVFGAAGLLVVAAWWVTLKRYCRRIGLKMLLHTGMGLALTDAIRLKNLDGGHGDGCYETGERPSLARRRFHHMTVIGFLLCFLATVTGTVYHYALALPAPYGMISLPKLFGMTGGVLLATGTLGLLWIRYRPDPALLFEEEGVTASLTWLLLVVALTGLLLPLVSTGKGLLLAIHLGLVLALFINFALGKFLHGAFRLLSLIRDQQ